MSYAASSLTELIPSVKPKPFFYVDFTKTQVERLLFEIKDAQGNSAKKVAGICVVTNKKEDEVFAFRVEWDTTKSHLLRTANSTVTVIDSIDMPEIAQDSRVQSVVEQGVITWEQAEAPEYKPKMPAKFVFVLASTLERLLAVPGCTAIRFRKALINTKINAIPTIDHQKFMNYIVESVPTFSTKFENARSSGAPLTDADVVAYDYGTPCPTLWQEMEGNSTLLQDMGGNSRILCAIARNQPIAVGPHPGVIINMGSIMDALWANKKAKRLLSNWKLYTKPVTLTLATNGKIIRINEGSVLSAS